MTLPFSIGSIRAGEGPMAQTNPTCDSSGLLLSFYPIQTSVEDFCVFLSVPFQIYMPEMLVECMRQKEFGMVARRKHSVRYPIHSSPSILLVSVFLREFEFQYAKKTSNGLG